MTLRASMLAFLVALGACASDDLSDDADRFISDGHYRRAILERDLLSVDNGYAQFRLHNYGPGRSWDQVDHSDPQTAPVTDEVLAALRAGEDPWAVTTPGTLTQDELPLDEAAWATLGERVLFDYVMFPDPHATRAAERGLLSLLGFQHDGERWVGLRLMDTVDGPQLALTCAVCHASLDEEGGASAVLGNRELDIGRLRLVDLLDGRGELPPDVDLGAGEAWAHLGAGRSDVLLDEVENPYAFPDFGGIADLPYLHHTSNWFNTGIAVLAIRIETVFMGRDTFAPVTEIDLGRIPRELAWALAVYLRSLPPPAPLVSEAPDDVAAGRAVFEASGCPSCHTPPTYTSDRLVGVEDIGTDPAAGNSTSRFTGYYRIPSLRGVGRTAPYLHHGALWSLEQMFDPERDEPGHPYGLHLDPESRDQLIRFLESI